MNNNPKRFSKIPWSKKNFECARKEFLNDFFNRKIKPKKTHK